MSRINPKQQKKNCVKHIAFCNASIETIELISKKLCKKRVSGIFTVENYELF